MLSSNKKNQTPRGLKFDLFYKTGKMAFRYAYSSSKKNCQGTILIFQDYHETIEYYFETIQHLVAKNFSVLIMDWHPQNFFSQTISFNENLKTYLKLLNQPDISSKLAKPYYILGTGFGSVVALCSAVQLNRIVSKMVLATPLLQPYGIESYLGIHKLFYFSKLMNRKYEAIDDFPNNVFTHDKKRFIRNVFIKKRTKLNRCTEPTVRGILGLVRAVKNFNLNLLNFRFNIPILFITAGENKVTNNKEVKHILSRLHSARLFNIPGAYHDLLQEENYYRKQFWIAFFNFIPGTPFSDFYKKKELKAIP